LRWNLHEPCKRLYNRTFVQGEIVGYIGPNGAGKSTTIKCLTGILVPTAGDVRIGGFVPWKDRKLHVKRIGVVFGQRSQMQWDLPLIDSLEFMKDVYNIPKEIFKGNLEELTSTLGLKSFLNTPVRQLSLGQRMRGDLAASLLHSPEVLFLDEPTIGLDIVAKEELRHLSDLEALCQRIIVIDHGHVMFDGAIDQFNASYGGPRVLIVRLKDLSPVHLEGVDSVIQDGNQVRISLWSETDLPELMAQIMNSYPVADFALEEPSLEDSVRRIYQSLSKEV